ncbi:flavodoxin family protein [Candidatus Bathyarchaeota archaeon]|nr:flavodoxin family protein [Candidatus Bathyarchaeota archaeon]
MVKVLGLMGSPRIESNTETSLQMCLKAAEEAGADTEMVRLIEKRLETCYGCKACKTTGVCRVEDDFMEVFTKMRDADAVIIASPSYCESVTAPVKALMDRAAYYNIMALDRSAFTGKPGGAIAVTARTGAATVWSQIIIFLLSHRFIVPGIASIPNTVGIEKGDVLNDAEGLGKVRELGRAVTELAFKLKA